MGKHPYAPPVDMDPETTICMRKIFEAIEDARLRGESDTSTLHYKRHTKMKRLNALSHSQSVESIASCGHRGEFVVRGLGTTADVPEPPPLSPPKTPASSVKKKKKRKKKRRTPKKPLNGDDDDDLDFFGETDASEAEAGDAGVFGGDAHEVELYAIDDPEARCAAFELRRDGRSTNRVRVVVSDDAGTSRVKDFGPDAYAKCGYGPLEDLIDDEKAALASLLCNLVHRRGASSDANLDDLPRPYQPSPPPSFHPRPTSPVTARILAEFEDSDPEGY